MNSLERLFQRIYYVLFIRRKKRTFSEEPTKPMDAIALARALAGEGRRHVSVGCSSTEDVDNECNFNAIYALVGNSDGLNVLPDFALVGVAGETGDDKGKNNVSRIALSTFSSQIIKDAILDLLAVEVSEVSAPLQNAVVDSFKEAYQVAERHAPDASVSMTAGLMFAEIIIFGHFGETRAYIIDRHHIEKVTTDGWEPLNTSDGTQDSDNGNYSGLAEGDEFPVVIHSRPVPRDGYILFCTKGLWESLSDQTIQEIVNKGGNPQYRCEALVDQVRVSDPDCIASVILMYFPPDFGPWR
ncbi:MAG: hypothetical protein GTO18_20595 [Anaerolineales bacterium]|nr:hypothetical protein [Anaerolineales bacterium]